MKSCQLLAFDLDGTLLQKGGVLSPLGAKALEEAAKAGIFPVPATGRMRDFLPPPLTALPCIRYAVTCNGASVWDLQEGKVLFSRLIPWKLRKRSWRFWRNTRSIRNSMPGSGRSPKPAAAAKPWKPGASPRKSASSWKSPAASPAACGKPWCGRRLPGKNQPALAAGPPAPEISQRLQAFGGLELASSFPDNLEINAAGCSKAQGLQALGAHLGIGREAMAAMGDSGNDRAMLEYAGFPIAMGNASPELKKIARAVAPPCEEDAPRWRFSNTYFQAGRSGDNPPAGASAASSLLPVTAASTAR